MNPKEVIKPQKLSHTPILKKISKDIRKINTKSIDDSDDLEKHTAFIIEDEELQRNIIVKKLPKDFKWYSAKSVKEAVDVYQNLVKKYITVDVLYLDLFLQDSKGTEFLKIAKTKGWLESALIVVMTGSKDIDTIKECIDCLANRFYKFYSKPVKDVEFERLSDEIKKHIDKISCPLKDYKIIKHIGAGAQADVYKVIGLKDRKIYAMKRVNLSNSPKNEIEAALNEIRLLYSLNHPNIIGYKEAIYDAPSLTLNIVMEFADGGDMSKKIKYNLKHGLIFRESIIWNYLIQILEGLNYLHEKNIIHRDLKSANIFC